MKKLTLAAALLASAAITAPAFAAGTLNIAQRQDPGNLDPLDTFMVAWGAIGSNIFDGLVRRDEQLNLQPGLAKSWEMLDDGMRIRFHLQEGVSFHNGEPFNAQAVKYSFDRLLGEEGAKGPQQQNYTSISEVKIIDENTVDFIMGAFDPVILTKLSGYGAMIVPPKYIAEVGEDVFDKKPVGTGPFKVVEYKPGQSLDVVANADYFEGAPKLDGIHWRFLREDATRLAELQAGTVDLMANLPFSSVVTIENADYAHVESVPGPTIYSLQFKTKDAITEDVRVRRALNMAVDKQAIVDAFLAGKGTPIATVQGPLSFGYDETIKSYEFNIPKAMELLAEAGVKPGTDLGIDYRAGNATFGEVVQAVAGFYSALGFNVSLNPVEDGVFLNDVVPNGKTHEAFQFAWGGWTFDFDNTAIAAYGTGQKWNPYGDYAHIDELIAAERAATDPAKREEILKQIGRVAHDEAIHLPLYAMDTVYAVSNDVEGFVPAPDNRNRYVNVTLPDASGS